ESCESIALCHNEQGARLTTGLVENPRMTPSETLGDARRLVTVEIAVLGRMRLLPCHARRRCFARPSRQAARLSGLLCLLGLSWRLIRRGCEFGVELAL